MVSSLYIGIFKIYATRERKLVTHVCVDRQTIYVSKYILQWLIQNIYYKRAQVSHSRVGARYLFTWLTFSQKGITVIRVYFLRQVSSVVYSGVDQFQ